MRKDLTIRPLVYPQPVLIIGTYGEDGTPDAMNAAWGGVGDDRQIFLCLSADHKTTKNILAKKEFTVSFGTVSQAAACDYVGLVSGNDVPDKLKKTGWHLVRSEKVDAPVIEELPLCLECRLVSYEEEHCHLFGDIVGVSADESILTDGKVDPAKLQPITFDLDNAKYIALGEIVADAFSCGKELAE